MRELKNKEPCATRERRKYKDPPCAKCRNEASYPYYMNQTVLNLYLKKERKDNDRA